MLLPPSPLSGLLLPSSGGNNIGICNNYRHIDIDNDNSNSNINNALSTIIRQTRKARQLNLCRPNPDAEVSRNRTG